MASLFKRKDTGSYGVLFDIGSGSVLAAIVFSCEKDSHPKIIWSHREHLPLRNIESLEQVSKSVMTALIQAATQLDSTGRKVLYQHNPNAKIKHIQSTVSAPWSHTVTKTINYSQKKNFIITKNLIEELLKTAEEKIFSELKTKETLEDLGLTLTTTKTMSMLSNGYRVASPVGNQATTFSLSRANVVVQTYVIQTLKETIGKIFPEQEHVQLSFMLQAFRVLQEVLPQKYDLSIVDITYEATELGVVRDGVLQHSTHTAFGSFSLARELATELSVPLGEAFGYLRCDEPLAFLKSLSDKQKAGVEKIFEAYTEKIAALFKETGDELSIPKTIILHADLYSEPLFLHLIEKAAKRCLKSNPAITLITQEILSQSFDDKATKEFFTYSSDTALLISAMFFHMSHQSTTITYV